MNLAGACAIGIALSAVIASPGFAACEAPAPGLHGDQVIGEKQPRIDWKAVSGATAYRVRLQSRVPNGRIVASHDTIVTSPSFVPPQPLAEDRAKVVARISAICGAQTSGETVFSFVIDATPTCRLGEVSAARKDGRAHLEWAPVKGASSYQVRMFSLDGAFISAQETRAPAAQLDLKRPGAVLSVRPSCAGGLGEAVYRVVAAD